MHTLTLVLTDRLGSVFLFEDPLPSNVVQHVYTLGPSYYGAFQAPVLQDRVSQPYVCYYLDWYTSLNLELSLAIIHT